MCHFTRAVAPPQSQVSHVTFSCFIKVRMSSFSSVVKNGKAMKYLTECGGGGVGGMSGLDAADIVMFEQAKAHIQ